MCPNPPLEAYAEEICTAAKIISAYCVENGLPHPSFGAQAPSVTLPSTAPQNVLIARQTIQMASLKIQQLATEPNEYLPYQAVHVSQPDLAHIVRHYLLRARVG
jgi:6-hydroxytryprostatin B O-methyltransferase